MMMLAVQTGVHGASQIKDSLASGTSNCSTQKLGFFRRLSHPLSRPSDMTRRLFPSEKNHYQLWERDAHRAGRFRRCGFTDGIGNRRRQGAPLR
jgi:hypothetical protein